MGHRWLLYCSGAVTIPALQIDGWTTTVVSVDRIAGRETHLNSLLVLYFSNCISLLLRYQKSRKTKILIDPILFI